MASTEFLQNMDENVAIKLGQNISSYGPDSCAGHLFDLATKWREGILSTKNLCFIIDGIDPSFLKGEQTPFRRFVMSVAQTPEAGPILAKAIDKGWIGCQGTVNGKAEDCLMTIVDTINRLERENADGKLKELAETTRKNLQNAFSISDSTYFTTPTLDKDGIPSGTMEVARKLREIGVPVEVRDEESKLDRINRNLKAIYSANKSEVPEEKECKLSFGTLLSKIQTSSIARKAIDSVLEAIETTKKKPASPEGREAIAVMLGSGDAILSKMAEKNDLDEKNPAHIMEKSMLCEISQSIRRSIENVGAEAVKKYNSVFDNISDRFAKKGMEQPFDDNNSMRLK